MTWRELLGAARRELGVDNEARIIVEEIAAMTPSELVTHLDEQVTRDAPRQLEAAVGRRRSGEPLQHIIGHWPFRDVDLLVDNRALVPRPETEIVVEHGLGELARQRDGKRQIVVELGTGSGAIACALAHEANDVEVLAVERAAPALELALANRERLVAGERARICFYSGDFYGALPPRAKGAASLVISNPPYLACEEWAGLDRVVRDFDPYDALVAGESGLEAIAAVIAGARSYLRRAGALVVEIAPHQETAVLQLAKSAGASTSEVAPDLAGRPRVLIARW